MRLARLATLAAAVALPLSLPGVAGANHTVKRDRAVKCGTKVVRSVAIEARTREAVVFTKAKKVGPDRFAVHYACLVRGPIRRLDDVNRSRQVSDPQLAGRFVAFERTLYLTEFDYASGIVVLDLRTGVRTVQHTATPDTEGDSVVHGFVVKRNGSVAWIGTDEQGSAGVFKVDTTTTAPQRLDSGQIDLASLRLTADRNSVVWISGGEQRTAPLR